MRPSVRSSGSPSRSGSSRRDGPAFFLGKRIFNRGEEESIRRAVGQLGWSEASSPRDANIVWDVWLNDAETDKHATPMPGQVLSRFPAMADCCRKAVYATIFSRLRRLLPLDAPLNDGNFIPVQFSLPRQKDALREHVEAATAEANRRGHARPYYIVKPDVGSRGDGIKLTGEPERKSWTAGEERVVQEYVARPMLMDGLKFDLRLYLLVADVQDAPEDDAPALMRLFLYSEGLARFAVEPYAPPAPDNLKEVHMHLTNYSLNRKAHAFKYCDDADGGDGSKRTVSSVFERLQSTGRIASARELWADISKLVARSMGVIQPILAGARGRWSNTCFQILGLDVLLDEDGHPWLIEINDHPSLRTDVTTGGGGGDEAKDKASQPSAVDEAVKLPMLRDAMRVVSTLHGLGAAERDDAPTAAAHAPRHAPPSGPPPSGPPPSGPPPSGPPSAAAAAGRSAVSAGAYGTGFMEVSPDASETRHLELLARLRDIFELHSPSSSVFEATWGDATREDAQATSSAGPRWKAATFSRFLQSAGLVGGHRASAVAAGLSRPDADLIFASIVGKGRTMDLLDFAEALTRVAARLFPSGACDERGGAPIELLQRLLARHFNESNGAGCAPASACAATAARAQAALRATQRGPPLTARGTADAAPPKSARGPAEAPYTRAPVTARGTAEAPYSRAPVTARGPAEAPYTRAPMTARGTAEAPSSRAPMTARGPAEAHALRTPRTGSPLTSRRASSPRRSGNSFAAARRPSGNPFDIS
jgi:hypothetical protein